MAGTRSDPHLPAPAHWRDAIPPAVRRWWAGAPRLALENTGALLLPALLPLRPSDRLLEIGCGRAALSAVLAERARLTCAPVGLEADRRLLLPPHDTVVFVQGRPTHLPFAENAFTAIVAGHQIRTWSDAALRAFLAEAWRVLAHNGLLVLWEVAPSRSVTINRVWRALLAQPDAGVQLRRFAEISRMAREAHFAWIQTLRVQPIIWPPGPRVGILMRKEYYDSRTIGLRRDQSPSYRSTP